MAAVTRQGVPFKVLHLGQWGTRAPLPEGAHAGLDSLLLALQATADPAVVTGRYELRVGTDVFTVDGASGSVRVRRGTADRPEAVLTTDGDTLHAVAFGNRPIAEAASPATCASTATLRPSAASPACYRR